MRYRRIALKTFISIFSLTFTCTPLWSGEPGEVIKEAIFKDTSLKEVENTKERKQKLWKEISPSFNFEEMAKRAMGKYWRERSDEEKKEFVELFANNIKSAYIRKIGPFFGERIISLREKQDNEYAEVYIELIKKTEEKMSVDFRLFRKNGEWRICDVIIEGVSIANNYRLQIYSFLIKSSYEELVQIFKQKQSKEKSKSIRWIISHSSAILK
ncbi:MAG: ABC transporter substrate-binding protein [Candidatus Scalindua sp.]